MVGRLTRLAVVLLYASAMHAADQAVLSCSPDTPVAQTGDTVMVRAFSSLPGSRFTWTPTAGSIPETTAIAHWALANVLPGIYRATVQSGASTAAESCSIRIVVTEKVRSERPAVESGSAFLLPDDTEASGYGLYSYLLLGAAPVDSTRERYTQVISAFLSLVPALTEFDRSMHPKDLNATYLLVTAKAPEKVSADWVLQHYDYARARSLLRLLRGQTRVGPYFLSSSTPLMGAGEIARPYLVQDMSGLPQAPKDLASWWVREFMNQAAQQRFWDTRNAQEFTIKLRTTLAVIGAGLPEMQASLKDWVAWIG